MGYLFVILASVLFGTVPTVQEYVIRQGASPLGLVILCNSAAGAAALLAALIRRESFRVGGRAFLAMVLAGGIGLFLTDFLLNSAYARIPVGLTTMIHFLYPTLVCLAMTAFFGEKLRAFKIGAILISFAGLFCLFGGSFGGNRLGLLAALGSAFCYAFSVISNDRQPLRDAPPMVCVFFINLSSVAAGLAVNGFAQTAVVPLTAASILPGILAGFMLSAGLILLAAGIKRLGAARSAFLNMLEPVTSLLVSSLVARTVPGRLTLLGSLLILAALTLYARGERKTDP